MLHKDMTRPLLMNSEEPSPHMVWKGKSLILAQILLPLPQQRKLTLRKWSEQNHTCRFVLNNENVHLA